MKVNNSSIGSNLDLLISILIAIGFLVLTSYQILLPVRRVLSFLLILFIPGYILSTVLYPRRSDMPNLERFFISIALSLSITILLGMGLNSQYIGTGLNLFPESLLILLIFFSCLSIYRRNRSDYWKISFFEYKRIVHRMSKDLKFVIFLGLLVVSVGYFYYFSLFQNNSKDVSTTQMYIEPINDDFQSVRPATNTDEKKEIKFVIRNFENQPMDYEIVEKTDGEEFVYLAHLHLEPGQEWSITRGISNVSSDNPLKTTFYAYRSPDFSKPYREVYIWNGE